MTSALVPDDKRTPEPGGPGVPDERADLHGLGSCDHPDYRQSEGAEGHPLCGGGEVRTFSASLSLLSPAACPVCHIATCRSSLSAFTCTSLQPGHFILLDHTRGMPRRPTDLSSQSHPVSSCVYKEQGSVMGKDRPVTQTQSLHGVQTDGVCVWDQCGPGVSAPGVFFASVRAVCC